MTSEKEELKKELIREYEERLDSALNDGHGETLWDMEDEVMKIKSETGKAVMAAKLKLKKIRSLVACKKCKIALGKDEVRGKHLDTTHGWVEYRRYQCSECRGYDYPADKELELSEESRMSPKKEDQLVRLSVHMAYEQVEKTYEELTGLPASKSGAQRVVQVFGEQMNEEGGKVIHKEIKGKGKEHVGNDGTMVNIRNKGF